MSSYSCRILYLVGCCYASILLSLPTWAMGFAERPEACTVLFTNPSSFTAYGSVPRNTAVDIFYHAQEPDLCFREVRALDEQTQQAISLQLAYKSESVFYYGHRQFIVGYARFHFLKPLSAHQKVDLYFYGKSVLHFQTNAQSEHYEGSILDLRPVDLKLALCSETSVLSPKELHHCAHQHLNYVFHGRVLTSFYDSEPVSPSSQLAETIKKVSQISELSELRELLSRKALLTSVRLDRMIYITKNTDGMAMPASALVIRPVHPIFAEEEVPLVLLLHGFMPAHLAPSQGKTKEALIGMLLAASGFYVVIPDNLGHGVSSGQVEPLFFPLVAFDVDKDAIDALLQNVLPHWHGELSILGFNQGAVEGFNAFRYQKLMPTHTEIRRVFLSEGPYNFEAMMDDFIFLQKNQYLRYEYLKWSNASFNLLNPFVHHYLSNQKQANRLSQELYDQVFDEHGDISKSFTEAYIENRDEVLPLRILARYSSVINSGQHYIAPRTIFGIYNYLYDPIVSLHHGEHLMNILHHPGNVFESLFSSDCRMSSYLEVFVRVYSKMRPSLSYHYCSYIAADDFLGAMRKGYAYLRKHA